MFAVELDMWGAIWTHTKSRILTLCGANDADHVDLMGSMVEMPHGRPMHKYLSKLLVGDLEKMNLHIMGRWLQQNFKHKNL